MLRSGARAGFAIGPACRPVLEGGRSRVGRRRRWGARGLGCDGPGYGGDEELLAFGGGAARAVPEEADALTGGLSSGHHAALLVGEDGPAVGVDGRVGDLDGVGTHAGAAHLAA